MLLVYLILQDFSVIVKYVKNNKKKTTDVRNLQFVKNIKTEQPLSRSQAIYMPRPLTLVKSRSRSNCKMSFISCSANVSHTVMTSISVLKLLNIDIFGVEMPFDRW